MFLVVLIKPGQRPFGIVRGVTLCALWVDKIVFPATDMKHRGARRVAVGDIAQAKFAETGLDVARVHNAEATSVTEQRCLALEDLEPESMECRNLGTPRPGLAEQRLDATLHFPSRLIGKGQRVDLSRRIALFDQPGDLACDHAGLAATGASQHEAGFVDAAHRALLG